MYVRARTCESLKAVACVQKANVPIKTGSVVLTKEISATVTHVNVCLTVRTCVTYKSHKKEQNNYLYNIQRKN